jgi:hypothetical protein
MLTAFLPSSFRRGIKFDLQQQIKKMKRIFLLSTFCALFLLKGESQGLKGFINKVTKDTSLNKVLDAASAFNKDTLSPGTIAGGLKEALQVGAERASLKLSATDGFFKDAAIKILMPEETKKAEQKLRSLGFGQQVDNAILSMNRAAEDASKSAAPIFINAVKQMSIQDAASILRGGDFAATNYLKSKTTANLTDAFRPVIEQSLANVDATKYWKTIFSTYNTFSLQKVNPDLTAYVTEKALSGIFYQLGLEEQKIRKDPAAQSTELLKKVFGK